MRGNGAAWRSGALPLLLALQRHTPPCCQVSLKNPMRYSSYSTPALRSRRVTTSPLPSVSGDFNLAAARRVSYCIIQTGLQLGASLAVQLKLAAVRRLSYCTIKKVATIRPLTYCTIKKNIQSDGSTRSPNLLSREDLGRGCRCDMPTFLF